MYSDLTKLNELINECKTELERLKKQYNSITANRISKNLLKTVEEEESSKIELNKTYDIEMPRNKIINMFERKSRNDASQIYQPSLHQTLLKEHKEIFNSYSESTKSSELYFLQTSSSPSTLTKSCSSQNCNASTISLKRLCSKASLSAQSSYTNEGESIISTAEEHLTSKLSLRPAEMTSLKPKSTSSTVSLNVFVRRNSIRIKNRSHPFTKRYNQSNSSITFNVDCASTPKKEMPRASTPKVGKKRRFAEYESYSNNTQMSNLSSSELKSLLYYTNDNFFPTFFSSFITSIVK